MPQKDIDALAAILTRNGFSRILEFLHDQAVLKAEDTDKPNYAQAVPLASELYHLHRKTTI